MTCGVLFTNEGAGPHDTDGCCLPIGHTEPHEFTATNGIVYQWETDFECDCDHCRRCEGDYCTVYWQRARPAVDVGGPHG